MHVKTTNSDQEPNHQKGFALISTILIMSLLMLLALGMLNLSTVEVKSGNADKAQAEAQANARMGLLIALGKLQSSLGPDARATANASILDSDPSTEEIDGVTNPHWLGAYKTIDPSNPDNTLLDPAALRQFSLNDIEWLVSNPNPTSTPDPLSQLTGDTVTLAQFVKDPDTAIVAGDIDSINPSLLTKAEAGLVKINNSSDNGNYAYWVADESMKARIDTLASANGSDVLDGNLVTSDSQRQSNYEIIQSTDFTSVLPNYKNDPNELTKLITPSTLETFNDAPSWKNWSLLNQDKFTNSSRSLPVDVANARLKKDLTAYIKGTYSNIDNEQIIDTRFNIASFLGPSFTLIKEWANLVDDPKVAQKVTPQDTQATKQKMGIYPVITQGAVALQQCFQQQGTDSVKGVLMIMPQIQLWNPHNVPLEAQDYIVQIGYSFDWWMQATGTRGTDKFTWSAGNPQLRSWQSINGQPPLPLHKRVTNDPINYQASKRFFTFVIKSQAFEPGETLVFYAKPPESGDISGVEYNLDENADTDIILNFNNTPEKLNLLVNEGTLDEFFYIIPDSTGTTTSQSIKDKITAGELRMERNFRSRAVLAGNNVPEQDNDIHINLYTMDGLIPQLLHAIKKPQLNTRFGVWQSPTFELSQYQNGSLLAGETLRSNPFGRNALINIGSSMLASKFDIFLGGGNVNQPPFAGQPHSYLNQWNIRSQESFSSDHVWGSDFEPSKWFNTFSFRDIANFLNTWEFSTNHYGNTSMDRLGGWWVSQVQDMAHPFFDYPTGEFGPLSLGSFQHANLSIFGWQPTYAFANAQAPSRFGRNNYQSLLHQNIFDLSYVLNASTWDSYYLSSIPQSANVTLEDKMRLPNSRMNLSVNSSQLNNLKDENGFNLSAAHVFINGGFNVNSTSVTAWKAFLSGALGQTGKTQEGGDTNDPTAAAMGRFLSPLITEPSNVVTDRTTTQLDVIEGWATTRTLNTTEIDALASQLVREVKLRGPFLSLADFVNRRLEPESSVSSDEKVYQEVLGTIQAAINKVSLDHSLINGHYYSNTGAETLTIKPATDWLSLNFSVTNSATEAMFGHPISEINLNGGLIQNYAPGFLSQADVLTKIGPSITVRGDTYTIRAYGDSRDNSGNILASAWCEAVVQRIPEPVEWDGTDGTLIQPDSPTASIGFGRQFQVLSFRWLNKKDVQPFADDDSVN